MSTQLQEQAWEAPQLRRHLEPALRRMSGPATLGDIVAETGLPAERTEPVLRELLDEYNGRLAVDENGELVYAFPRGLHRPRNLREFWAEVGRTLWAWFKIAYKIGIAVMLVLYFVVFLVLMIALIVAAVAGTRGGDSDIDLDMDGCGDGGGGGCFFPLDWIWFVDTGSYRESPRSFTQHSTTPYRAKPVSHERKKPAWLPVFEFVFGEEKPRTDPLEQERQLLAFIRDQRGRVTAAEIVALTGQSLDEAEQTLLHLMVAHGGDVEVSDDGSIIYTFDRLLRSAATERNASRKWSWWWERREQPEPLNRNSAVANWVIGLLNAFNLAWSTAISFGGPTVIGEAPIFVWWLLGPVPLAFSALFYLIPLLRWWKLQGENAARAERNATREVAAKVFRHHVGSDELDLILPDEAVRYLHTPGDEVQLPQRFASILEALAARWEGEPEVDESGRVGYRFTRLRQEVRDVQAAREGVTPDQTRLGAIEYDSEES